MDIKPRYSRPKPKPIVEQPEEPKLPSINEPLEVFNLPELEPKLPKRRRLWLWIGLALAVLIMAIVLTISWYNLNLQAVGGDSKHVRVKIEKGSTADIIAEQLYQANIIRSRLVFGIYLQTTGKKNMLQAGNYVFSSSQSTPDIVENLIDGKVEAYNVTILPGKTLVEIKQGLIKDGFGSAEIDQAFAKKYTHQLLISKPGDQGLEGYIYPETYQVDGSTTVEKLLERSFDEFYKQIQKKDLINQLAAKDLNLHQAVTLASIVELEVTSVNDRATVSQVFHKRLGLGMRLESDPTFKYAAKLLGQEPSVNIDSPYNTRRYGGLPPGPIGNLDANVLEAVAKPANTDYLYFVSGDDGVTHFSMTLDEHLTNVSKFCTKLCRQ